MYDEFNSFCVFFGCYVALLTNLKELHYQPKAGQPDRPERVFQSEDHSAAQVLRAAQQWGH